MFRGVHYHWPFNFLIPELKEEDIAEELVNSISSTSFYGHQEKWYPWATWTSPLLRLMPLWLNDYVHEVCK
jgi:hypothetical protein